MFVAFGIVTGVVCCLACAFLFKRFSLGFVGNIVTGVLVGGSVGLIVGLFFPEFDYAHVVISPACVWVMFSVRNAIDAQKGRTAPKRDDI